MKQETAAAATKSNETAAKVKASVGLVAYSKDDLKVEHMLYSSQVVTAASCRVIRILLGNHWADEWYRPD